MFFFCLSVKAEQSTGNISTSQTGGRYEIVQSPFLRKCLFKLDKYTGKVYQYIIDSEKRGKWERVVVLLESEPKDKERINFQLFFGGIAAADCFLLNIHTGETYQLTKDKNDIFLFEFVETFDYFF